MSELSPEILTLIMAVVILVGILVGFPIAFVFGTISLVLGYLVFGTAVFPLIYMRIFDMMTNYLLLAVPLFVFMGVMLHHAGLAEKLYNVLYLWFGNTRGGLAIVTILVGITIAKTVGIIAASIAMLSVTGLPAMLKRNYSKSLASGTVCASGCLGILIPPSIMLVTYGMMAGLSVGRLFFGAIIPGLILSGTYLIYVVVRCYLQPAIAPAAPPEERASIAPTRKILMFITAVVPIAVVILSVLGVIFFGIAPPTEAAAIGGFVAMLLATAHGRFNFGVLKEAVTATIRISAFIFLFIAMAMVFTSVFLGFGGGAVVTGIILGAPGGEWGIFAAIMFMVFVLGMFLDWLPILFIIVPIATPIAADLGFDSIWFAIMVCTNLQMCFMTPPFAGGIFITRGLAPPEVTTGDIIRGVLPFVGLVIVVLGLLVAFPELVTWLPNQMIR